MDQSARAKADNRNKRYAKSGRIMRARSCQRSNKNEKETQLTRSHSVEQSEKILNVDSKYDAFLNVAQVFADILNNLEIDENYEEVHKKLITIQSLIDKKLQSINRKIKKESNSKSKASSLSNLLTSSTLSINSDKTDISLDDNTFWETFMRNIDCPFCSISVADKKSLINHLDENCAPHKNKKFVKNSHIPFSTFQILPNNAFKCNVCPNSVQHNIKSYITHKHSSSHTLLLNKATETKFYSENLFCSCCKVQIPNNYSQLIFHIEHQVHKNRSENLPKYEHFLSQKTYCVFTKREKFRCLVCSNYQCDTPKEILKHFEELKHMMRVQKNYLSVVYCEFCCVNVHIFEIINHFMDKKHKKMVETEKNGLEGNFTLCFFCGFVCPDLMALSLHMDSQCQVVNEMRGNLKSITQDKETSGVSKDADEAKFKNSTKEEYCIIVKDNVDVVKLYKYFTKFGKISAIEIYNKKDVKIKFSEKTIVEDILKLQNVLQMDGKKLKLTTHETVPKPKDTISKSSNINFSENKKNEVSNIMDESDDDESVEGDDKLQNLFERVSCHLGNNTLKLEYECEKKLTEDCVKALKVETCQFVGFSACELTFPVESYNLYCNVDMKDFSYLNKSERLHLNLLKALYLKMCDSELWKGVNLCVDNCFPHILCEHKETQVSCTIVIAKGAMVLTDMFRDCLKNDEVRSFCLIIRFWLSVHGLNIRNFDYVIISILVFFLISEKIVDFPFDKYEVPNFNLLDKMIKGSMILQKPTSGAPATTFDVKELFQKFLLFLNAFDFDNNAICLPIEHPVPKALLMKNEIKFYLNLSNTDQLVKSSMCILEPVVFRNLAEQVEEQDKKSLLKIVRSTIKHYKFK